MKLAVTAAIFAALITQHTLYAATAKSAPKQPTKPKAYDPCVEALFEKRVDADVLQEQLYALADKRLSPKSADLSKEVLEIYNDVRAAKPKNLEKQIGKLVSQMQEHSIGRSEKTFFTKVGHLLISKDATYYYAIEIQRPEFFASGSLSHKGSLSMFFEFAPIHKAKVEGNPYRSKSLRGREQYFAIFNHFGGHKRIKAVSEVWLEGSDTYAFFKKLHKEGVDPKDAVWQGFTGKMAKEAGFTKAVINLENYHGSDKEVINWPRDEVDVEFSR